MMGFGVDVLVSVRLADMRLAPGPEGSHGLNGVPGREVPFLPAGVPAEVRGSWRAGSGSS